MRWKAAILAGSLAPLAGCMMFENTARNAINEPLEYLDEKKVSADTRADANRVWDEICRNHPPETFSHDFARGFKDGYADHLDFGGSTPPALPPRCYRRSNFYNPQGHARIRDWFAGFQQGLDAAKESGKRGYMTVPVLLPEPQKNPVLDVKQIPSEDCTAPGKDPRKPLPPPKPVEPMTGLPSPMRPNTSTPMPKDPIVPPVPNPGPEPKPVPPPGAAGSVTPMTMPRADIAPQNTAESQIRSLEAQKKMLKDRGIGRDHPDLKAVEAQIEKYKQHLATRGPTPGEKGPGVETQYKPINTYTTPFKPAEMPTTEIPIPAPESGPVSANETGSLKSGRFEVSPVREGLRVIVKPVREGAEK